MANSPPLIFAWIAWFLTFCAFVILLGGVSASQRFCSRSAANSLVAGSGGSGYFAPVSCDKFYRFTWFTTWYQFAMMIIVPIVLAMGRVHTWRYGLIFLLVPLTYLLMTTANTTFLLMKLIESNSGAAKAIFSGAIIGCVGNFVALILFGIRDLQGQQGVKSSSREQTR